MNQAHFLEREHFQTLIDILTGEGYRCLGPQVRDGAIIMDELTDAAQLPVGIHDQQTPGTYQLNHSDSTRWFAWANGPQALKPLLFAPRETLWRAERDEQGKINFIQSHGKAQKTAVFGVRSCDLAGMRVQDGVLLQDQYRDDLYAARRESLFTVAVNCSHPAETCFCAATGDGPTAEEGYDLLLTELDEGFLINAGSEAGEKVLARLPLDRTSDQQYFDAGQQAIQAAEMQTRKLPANVDQVLLNNLDHGRWQEVAQRCLSCGNCTMVCPTCFCHREVEQPELDGSATEHLREWDSCFTEGHSYIHGMVIRKETEKRYRQWLTHKLATWVQQFGNSGCVGCGRCIAWCPVGIDLTEEANAIAGDSVD
jgi:sulfhydrogenase subunit beta (sulfur reductase)